MKKESVILDEILSIAYDLLVAGSEVGRAEKEIERMCRAYQMEEVEVFIITSFIVVSVKGKSGEVITQTKRIREYQINFTKLEFLEQLVEQICQKELSIKQIQKRRKKIAEAHELRGMSVVYCFVCMIFTLFFGGSILDGIASFCVGGFVKGSMHFFTHGIRNRFVWNILASAGVGLGAWGLCRLGIAEALDKIIIGNIMLLIPGLAMINGLKDLIEGEMLAGLLRLMDALIQAAAVALGVAMVLIPLG